MVSVFPKNARLQIGKNTEKRRIIRVKTVFFRKTQDYKQAKTPKSAGLGDY